MKQGVYQQEFLRDNAVFVCRCIISQNSFEYAVNGCSKQLNGIFDSGMALTLNYPKSKDFVIGGDKTSWTEMILQGHVEVYIPGYGRNSVQTNPSPPSALRYGCIVCLSSTHCPLRATVYTLCVMFQTTTGWYILDFFNTFTAGNVHIPCLYYMVMKTKLWAWIHRGHNLG